MAPLEETSDGADVFTVGLIHCEVIDACDDGINDGLRCIENDFHNDVEVDRSTDHTSGQFLKSIVDFLAKVVGTAIFEKFF